MDKRFKHGLVYHPLYRVWQAMRVRVGVKSGADNETVKLYQNRGISICEEWLDFSTFFEWAEPRWKTGLQIDRIDNNGNYCPENCRFVTNLQNGRNTRKSKRWIIGGLIFDSARHAAKICKVSHTQIMQWCNGGMNNGYYYPPKLGCYSISKY